LRMRRGLGRLKCLLLGMRRRRFKHATISEFT
jgi:hypothetical protein